MRSNIKNILWQLKNLFSWHEISSRYLVRLDSRKRVFWSCLWCLLLNKHGLWCVTFEVRLLESTLKIWYKQGLSTFEADHNTDTSSYYVCRVCLRRFVHYTRPPFRYGRLITALVIEGGQSAQDRGNSINNLLAPPDHVGIASTVMIKSNRGWLFVYLHISLSICMT